MLKRQERGLKDGTTLWRLRWMECEAVCGPPAILTIWPLCMAHLISGLFTNGTGPFVKISKRTRFRKRDGTFCFVNVPCKAGVLQMGQSHVRCLSFCWTVSIALSILYTIQQYKKNSTVGSRLDFPEPPGISDVVRTTGRWTRRKPIWTNTWCYSTINRTVWYEYSAKV